MTHYILTSANPNAASFKSWIMSGNDRPWPKGSDWRGLTLSERPVVVRKFRSPANRYPRTGRKAVDGDLRACRRDARALLKSP